MYFRTTVARERATGPLFVYMSPATDQAAPMTAWANNCREHCSLVRKFAVALNPISIPATDITPRLRNGFSPSAIARYSRVVSESTVTKMSVSGTASNTAACARRFPWLAWRIQRICGPSGQVPSQCRRSLE